MGNFTIRGDFVKKFAIVICALACMLAFSGCESKAERYYSEGITAFEEGDFKTAERKLRKALDNGCKKEDASEIIEIIDVYEDVQKYINNREFDKAIERIEDMPEDYEDYDVSDDIFEMTETLASAEEAADIFDMIKKRYDDGEFDTALSLIGYIDTEYLSSADVKELDKIKTDIESNELSESRRESSTSKTSERVSEMSEDEEENKEKEDKDEKSEKTENIDSSVKYRVRKSSGDADSQLGAFSELDNAKRLADANEGYAVYNMQGEVVYQP